jgi:hypothetical protein
MPIVPGLSRGLAHTSADQIVPGLTGLRARSWRQLYRRPGMVSATPEFEAIATVENEATQTDWMGDLGGGLGVDQAELEKVIAPARVFPG